MTVETDEEDKENIVSADPEGSESCMHPSEIEALRERVEREVPEGGDVMTVMEIYTRLLAEMHWSHSHRSTDSTRLHLQDVLISLRAMAAAETGMSSQEVQDKAEAIASKLVRA